jgi:hypothetical protein
MNVIVFRVYVEFTYSKDGYIHVNVRSTITFMSMYGQHLQMSNLYARKTITVMSMYILVFHNFVLSRSDELCVQGLSGSLFSFFSV